MSLAAGQQQAGIQLGRQAGRPAEREGGSHKESKAKHRMDGVFF